MARSKLARSKLERMISSWVTKSEKIRMLFPTSLIFKLHWLSNLKIFPITVHFTTIRLPFWIWNRFKATTVIRGYIMNVKMVTIVMYRTWEVLRFAKLGITVQVSKKTITYAVLATILRVVRHNAVNARKELWEVLKIL